MARRLSNLSQHGKYTLLWYLSDLKDLKDVRNFCIVFPEFRRTFHTFRDKLEPLEPEVILQDARKYARESMWIAHYRGFLNRWSTSITEVKEAIDQYVAFECRGIPVDMLQWRRGDSCYDIPISALRDKMIANHRYILSIYRHLVNHELEKRDAATKSRSRQRNGAGTPLGRSVGIVGHLKEYDEFRCWATESEKNNIVRALYRLWVLVLMSCEHSEPLDRHMWMGCIMGLWNSDFWECMQVRAVQAIIYDVIQSAVDEIIYKGKGRKVAREGVDPEKFGPSLRGDIASSSILHDFPSLIPRWFQSAGTSTNPQRREDHIKDIREFLKWNVCKERDVPSPNIHIFNAHYEYYTPSMVERHYINQNTPFRRVCKRGVFANAVPHDGHLLWIRIDDIKNPENSNLDLNVCIWDDWRCKAWGFRCPSFNRANIIANTH